MIHLTCGQCRHFTGEPHPSMGEFGLWKRCAAGPSGITRESAPCEDFLPPRVQRRRTRGWRMPSGAVYVGRPSKWGNPIELQTYQFQHADGSPAPWNEDEARSLCLRDYEAHLRMGNLRVTIEDVRRELRGRPLVCWCRLGKPCHADVLLEVANSEE